MKTEDLLTSLFEGTLAVGALEVGALEEGRSHPLAAPMATWLASSRRFTAFVTDFHPKIRKKLRAAQEPETLLDLRLELETAYLLLRERSLRLVYEPQPEGQRRGPDFEVAYTTSTAFTVEVARLRARPPETPPDARQQPTAAPTDPLASERLTGVVCAKLGQLLPQRGNLLLVGVEPPPPTPADLQDAMLRLQQRAEGDDPVVVQRYGFRDRSDFFRHYRRLSAVLVRGTPLQAGEPVVMWVNPQAQRPLPSKVRTALHRSHTL